MNFDEWCDDVEGRVIGSGQCVALSQDFSARVAQGGFLSTDTGPYPGYAGNIWYADIAGYTKKPATSIAMPGWQAIWGKGPFTPSTHIAVVINDAGLGVNCMTQNPGAAKRQIIPKAALLGYLAPDKESSSGGTATVGNPIIDGALGVAKNLDSLNTLKNWVSDSGNWQRVGLYTLGALLCIFAVFYLFRNETMTLVKGVTK